MSEDTKKRNDRQYKWQKENTDRINFTMPKGRKAEINQCAERSGMSAAAWINEAITEKMDRVEDPVTANRNIIDLSNVPDLEAYARSSGMTMVEYAHQAIMEKMIRQDESYTEDIERVPYS